MEVEMGAYGALKKYGEAGRDTSKDKTESGKLCCCNEVKLSHIQQWEDAVSAKKVADEEC